MKHVLLIIAVLITHILSAQVPQSMSYQAVIRNSGNALVQNSNVGIRVSILQGGPTGNVVYQEVQTIMTNVNGLMTMEIGQGTPVVGLFSTIPWSSGQCYLQTEIDPAGGTAYSMTVTTQLLSVPYALYAKTSEDAARIKTLIYTGF
jgi:hypothetical protein